MRKLVLPVVVAGIVWSAVDPVNACGDKFLLIGRGQAPGGYAAVHPASILIVRHERAAKSSVIDDPQLANSLRRAGHQVRVIDGAARLTETLAATRYDVVMADLPDAVVIEPAVREASAKPALVPVMYTPSPSEIAAAEKQFVCLLKAPEKVTRFLGVIDDLMKTRLAAAKAGSPTFK